METLVLLLLGSWSCDYCSNSTCQKSCCSSCQAYSYHTIWNSKPHIDNWAFYKHKGSTCILQETSIVTKVQRNVREGCFKYSNFSHLYLEREHSDNAGTGVKCSVLPFAILSSIICLRADACRKSGEICKTQKWERGEDKELWQHVFNMSYLRCVACKSMMLLKRNWF